MALLKNLFSVHLPLCNSNKLFCWSQNCFFLLLEQFLSQQVRTIFETKYHKDFSCKVMYQFKNQGKDIIKSPSVQLDWVVVLKKKNEIKSLLRKKIASSTCFKVRYECAYYMSARRSYVRLASRWFYYGVLRSTTFNGRP